MITGLLPLPPCARGRFDPRQSFAALAARSNGGWAQAVVEVIQEHPVLGHIEPEELRQAVWEISRAGAADLATLISAGSLLYPMAVPLRRPDPAREECMRQLLDTVGEGARFFTNHGEAEEGENADFLASSFHANVIAGPTLDICLIGVTDEKVLVLWRFEED